MFFIAEMTNSFVISVSDPIITIQYVVTKMLWEQMLRQ